MDLIDGDGWQLRLDGDKVVLSVVTPGMPSNALTEVARVPIKQVRELVQLEPVEQGTATSLGDVRAAVLREALDAIPQDLCLIGGCNEPTCALTRVNVAISVLLDKSLRTAQRE